MDDELWDLPPVTFRFPVEWGKCREFALALLDEDPARPETDRGSGVKRSPRHVRPSTD